MRSDNVKKIPPNRSIGKLSQKKPLPPVRPKTTEPKSNRVLCQQNALVDGISESFDQRDKRSSSIDDQRAPDKKLHLNLFNTGCVPLSDSPMELLDYYRRKVDSLTEDHEVVQRRLDQIADAIGDRESLSWEVHQQESEIEELQRALSDLQVCLFQERDHVLRLYSENDRLKIHELDDRRKIQHLLQLSGLGPSEVTYFIRENADSATDGDKSDTNEVYAKANDSTEQPKYSSALVVAPIIPAAPAPCIVEITPTGKVIRKNVTQSTAAATVSSNSAGLESGTQTTQTAISRLEHEATLRELEMAKATVRSLRTQLTEQARNSRDQIDALMEDRRALQQQWESTRKQNEEKIRLAAEQLKRCQDLLYDSTKEFLAQRNQFRQAERVWLAEKDKLFGRFSERKQRNNEATKGCRNTTSDLDPERRDMINGGNSSNLTSDPLSSMDKKLNKQDQLLKTVKNLEQQLDQQQKLGDMYRDQVIQLEDELVRIREEGLSSTDAYREHGDRLRQRIQTMNNKYRALERRRQLEMEGYRTDIGALRKKLRDVEKQLLKLTLGLTENVGVHHESKDVDVAILKQVQSSATRSSQILNELKTLKLKMYSLEDELRKI